MRPISLWICLTFSLVCLWCMDTDSGFAQSSSASDEVVRRATFVFIGTVSKINATTMPEVKASDSTAVVRVDEVIDGPGAPPDVAGKEITVQLARPGSLNAGQRATFFTKGWLMGESMAVIEVAPAREVGNPQQVREMVQASRQKSADEALQGETASAEIVVSGTVSNVAPGGAPEIPSEHTPQWQKAVIAVQTTLKGHVTGNSITVVFPGSDDPYWRGSPKFKEGQQGIWLLHRNQVQMRGMQNQLTALKPLDFQPLDQLPRIQRLLKSGR
ncbi:MAG: hypothetical protein WA738_06995 [Candidatus Angelobacter sp.]